MNMMMRRVLVSGTEWDSLSWSMSTLGMGFGLGNESLHALQRENNVTTTWSRCYDASHSPLVTVLWRERTRFRRGRPLVRYRKGDGMVSVRVRRQN